MSKIAFIFPGQGAQKAGMGKDFYENSKTAAEVIDRASELLGLDMKALCFEENDLLDQTEYTQAALVTVCMAMEKVLRERGFAPDVTAGLSLGEYCAIASAGGMSTENAITTVRKRGILMQNAVPGGQGAMAAVLGLDAGKYFAAGDPVCDVIDKSKPMLQLTAYEKDLDKLQPNTHFTFKVNGMPDTTFTAELVSVDQMVDNVNRSIKVYARILEAYSNFRPGMYVAAKITDKKH